MFKGSGSSKKAHILIAIFFGIPKERKYWQNIGEKKKGEERREKRIITCHYL